MIESKQDAKRRVVSMRFSSEETARLETIVRRAKQRSGGYATIAGIMRELAGVSPMSIVTEADRKYLISLGAKQKKTQQRGASVR